MITPAFSLTATERVLPKLALNFTTASLDSRITFTRSGNTATVTNSSGVIVGINADLPRFDYDPTTLVCRGLLIEETRTNALVNSLLDGTSLITQTVTVTAVARTLSFYGTGTIVLSGTASATVVGTGAYPSRQTYTFTPTAGALILTVTGTVQFAQLEIGAFATSYIPTTTATTRNADSALMTGTNFSDWFTGGATAGTFQTNFIYPNAKAAGGQRFLGFNAFTGFYDTGGFLAFFDGTAQRTLGTMAASTTVKKYAIGFGGTTCSAGKNSALATAAYSNAAFAPTALYFGRSASTTTGEINGWIQQVYYWPQRLTNAELQAFSK